MLDATVGGIAANSYVTVAEATAYFADRSFASAWDSFADQDDLLVTASQVLDWFVTWKGKRATETQRMDWPRTGTYTDFGTEYSELVIPEKVKVAVYELALSSIESDRTADNPLMGLEMVKAGSLQLKVAGGLHNKMVGVVPEKIWRILAGLYSTSGISVVHLLRA